MSSGKNYLDRSPTNLLTSDIVESLARAIKTGTSSLEDALFVRLPADPARQRARFAARPWQITLSSLDGKSPPLHLEICGDIFVGRSSAGINPDVDLNPFDGEDKGVSRQHALLRPTEDHLMVIDLDSTNGTMCNDQLLDPGTIRPLSDGDLLAFGMLGFGVIVSRRAERQRGGRHKKPPDK